MEPILSPTASAPSGPPEVVIRMSGRQHGALRSHLFPGDGLEAAAILLCGRRLGDQRHVSTVHEVVPVPYDACTERTPVRVTWRADLLVPLLERAARYGLALVKIHSHTGMYARFSEVDDAADASFFPSVMGWTDDGGPHGSAVMLPDGSIFARAAYDDGDGATRLSPVALVAVAGEDIALHFHDEVCDSRSPAAVPEFARRHAQAFGAGTTERLRRLTIAVIGCSGTGSPLVEMLARLGVGRLVLVDPDVVEQKNLNRIYGSTMEDAVHCRPKVEVLARMVRSMGLGTDVVPVTKSLFDPETVRLVASCDVAMGCVDTAEGRDLLNRLCAYYVMPYFDVGVRLDADGHGGVDQIAGTVHYLQPDGSSLLSRGVYTHERLQAEALRRADPERYKALRREKYIIGVNEDRPAVISVNTFFAAHAVNELLARLHPFRDDPNGLYAAYGASLTQARLVAEPDGDPCSVLARKVGRGDALPLLGMPSLSEPTAPAGSQAHLATRP